MPMPQVYADQGFERHEIQSMTAWERQSGSVHEASNFNSGNEPSVSREPERPKMSPEVVKSLATDMAAAFASGPFTGGENLV